MRISDWSSDVCSSDLEIHKSFKPFFVGGSDEEKKAAGEAITRQFTLLTGGMKGDYLFGAFSVADPFLFVMLRWAFAFGIGVPEPLIAYFDRIQARPAIARAIGRASCRERVCQYVKIPVVAESLK